MTDTVAILATLGLTAILVYLGIAQLRTMRREADERRLRRREQRKTHLLNDLQHKDVEKRFRAVRQLETLCGDEPRLYESVIAELSKHYRLRSSDGSAPGLPSQAGELPLILVVLARRTGRYGDGESRRLDLSGADLRGARLPAVHLEAALLTGARLGGDPFGRNGEFENVHFPGAIFLHADMRHATFRGATMTCCSLVSADARGADFSRADLRWSDFEGADLTGAVLYGADLRYARGLTLEQIRSALIDDQTRLSRTGLLPALNDQLLVLARTAAKVRSRVRRILGRAA